MRLTLRVAGLAAVVAGSIVLASLASYHWEELSALLHKPAGDQEAVEEEEEEPSEDETEQEAAVVQPVAAPSLSQQNWIAVTTEGEEGNPVEVEYDPEKGWAITGWRVKGLSLYGAPPFKVQARKVDDIPKFPCSDCHKKMEVNHRPHVMTKDHEDLIVDHANDRLWCTDCHSGKGLDFLVSRRGNPIDMDLGYLQCGECHFDQLKDWEFGVHGRRVGLFSGERVLRTCTECHNAHQPQIKPLKPNAPPQYRANLSAFKPKPVQHPPIWERLSEGESP